MTLPSDSPEVEAEAVEIETALRIEEETSQGGYAACFKNNQDRNGWRTWTGILMQGVSTNLRIFRTLFNESFVT